MADEAELNQENTEYGSKGTCSFQREKVNTITCIYAPNVMKARKSLLELPNELVVRCQSGCFKVVVEPDGRRPNNE